MIADNENIQSPFTQPQLPAPLPPRSQPRRWKRNAVLLAVVAALGVFAVLGILKIQKSFLKEVVVEASLEFSPPQGLPARDGVIGRPVPDFTLPGAGGRVVHLKDVRGKAVVLLFFASWNDLSLDGLGVLEDARVKLEEARVTAFAVENLESPESAQTISERGQFTVPILADSDGSVGEAYGIATLPEFFFIDADGILRERVSAPLTTEDILAGASRLYR